MDDDKEYLFYFKDIKKRFEVIWQDYRENVDLYYSDIYKTNPEYFPLYRGMKVKYILLPKGTVKAIAYYESGTKNGVKIEHLNLPSDFFETSTNRSLNDLSAAILKELQINISHYYFNEPVFMSKMTDVASYDADGGWGPYFAQRDAQKYLHDDHTNLELIKPDIEPEQKIKLPNTISKYRPLLDVIDDSEFAFELQQAYSCYKSQLFLASALVVGRLLETTCQLLIKKHNENDFFNIRSQNRTIGTFADTLEKQHVLNSSEKNDLIAAAMYRNTVAHSTKGTDFQIKIQEMFRMLTILVEKYQAEN